MVSTIERFHCILDSHLGHDGVHYREFPLYICCGYSLFLWGMSTVISQITCGTSHSVCLGQVVASRCLDGDVITCRL